MSCCSSRRPPLQAGVHPPGHASLPARQAPGTQAAHPDPRQIVFELVTDRPLRILSPVTGRTYRFDEAGDRQVTDPRDATQLMRTTGLRML